VLRWVKNEVHPHCLLKISETQCAPNRTNTITEEEAVPVPHKHLCGKKTAPIQRNVDVFIGLVHKRAKLYFVCTIRDAICVDEFSKLPYYDNMIICTLT